MDLPHNETTYCFAKFSPWGSEWDFSYGDPKVKQEDIISVLWTAEELAEFQPNIGVHEMKQKITDEMIDLRAKTLKNYLRRTSCNEDDRARIKSELRQLDRQIIVFVQVN